MKYLIGYASLLLVAFFAASAFLVAREANPSPFRFALDVALCVMWTRQYNDWMND